MNKKLFLFAGILTTIMILGSGCGKDDSTPKTNFTYDGKTYDITQGVMFTDTLTKGELYGYYMIYLSDGFTIHWSDAAHTSFDSITGTGNAMELYLVSDAAIDPADGKYDHYASLKATKVTPEPFKWQGGAYVNYEIDGENSDESNFELISGTIDLKKTGTDQYELKLNTTAETQKELKGYINLKITRLVEEANKSASLRTFLHK